MNIRKHSGQCLSSVRVSHYSTLLEEMLYLGVINVGANPLYMQVVNWKKCRCELLWKILSTVELSGVDILTLNEVKCVYFP